MTFHRHSSARGSVFSYPLVILLLTAALLTSCTPSESGEDAQDSTAPTFAVNPDDLGEEYVSDALGISFQPPRDWPLLEGDAKEQVLGSLPDDSDPAQPVDVFFSIETMSFAVLQRPADEDGRLLSVAEYDPLLSEALAPGDDPAGVIASERTEFSVNNVDVIHYRHVVADRIGASLLFEGPDNTAILLQYSLPASAMDSQLRKVESSIGTLRRLR